MLIKDAKSLNAFGRSTDHDVVALAVCAFDRFGLHDFLSRYHILAMRQTADIPQLREYNDVHAMETVAQSRKHLGKKKMNHMAMLQDRAAQSFINRLERPLLITPQASPETEALIRKQKWQHLAPPAHLVTKFENKKHFRALLDTLGIAYPKTIITTMKQASFDKAARALKLPFVLQAAESRGGKGTFLIQTEVDMQHAISEIKKGVKTDLVISQMVDAHSVSTSAVATRWGVFTSNLQAQIIEQGSATSFGNFLGHDWGFANRFPAATHAKAMAITKKIGQAMYKKGFRGYFGIDFVLDKKTGKLLVLECNPRFTGALPTLDLIQARLRRPLFCALHVLEFIADEHKGLRVNAKVIQKLVGGRRTGSHRHITSIHPYATFVNCPFKPGTYLLTDTQPRYQSDNIELKQLTDKNQVIITQMLPARAFTPARGHVCRILSSGPMVDSHGRVTKRIRDLVAHIHEQTAYTKA